MIPCCYETAKLQPTIGVAAIGAVCIPIDTFYVFMFSWVNARNRLLASPSSMETSRSKQAAHCQLSSMTDDELATVMHKHSKKTEATKHLAHVEESPQCRSKFRQQLPNASGNRNLPKTFPLPPWRIMHTCQTRVTFSSMK